MIDKVIYKVGDKYVYVLDWISVNLDMLYEINWVDWELRGVLWGYYIYGRDSVIIFDMGIYRGDYVLYKRRLYIGNFI